MGDLCFLCPDLFCLIPELYAYYRTLSLLALQAYRSAVECGSVLDYGKSKSRSACFLGVALVCSIETLEYPFVMLGGNADAVIRDL